MRKQLDLIVPLVLEKVSPQFVDKKPIILNETTVQCPPYKSITKISGVFFYVLINGTRQDQLKFSTQVMYFMIIAWMLDTS